MPLSQDKTGLLKSFLGSLPGHIAARLALAVEMDRLMDGHVLPHDEILAGLRPALGHAPGQGQARTLTPLRLFCRPFQDLLTTAPRTAKLKADIARSSLAPVWSWVSQTLIPDETAAFVQTVRPLILARSQDAMLACAAQFWSTAAAAMKPALAGDAARAALGGAIVAADAREMALLLDAGPLVERLQALMAPPVTQFGDDLLWRVRQIHDEMVLAHPDAAPYVAVICMRRLARPCEALRLPLMVARHADDTLISKTDMGLVGEIIFTRMESLRDAIQATRHPLFDADILMEQVRNFADLSSGIVKEIALKRDGEWGRRLMSERVDIGKVMEGFMDRAPREIAAAMPVMRANGPRTSDFSRHPGTEKHEMALRYARLVAGCRNFAAAASFAARQKTVYDEIATELKRYVEDVLKALRDPDLDRAAVAQCQFQLCIELTGILFSAEEAEFVRRRGRAAQQAA